MNVRPPLTAPRALQWALIALAATALAGYVFFAVPKIVNTDSAAGILLAKELVASGGFVRGDWAYVSDSLMLDGSVNAGKLGVLLFGATPAALQFVAGVGALFLLCVCHALARSLGASRWAATASGFVLLLGPSLLYQDLMVSLPASYQTALVLLFVLSAVRYGWQQGSNSWVLAGALGTWMLAASTPKKALAYLVIPLVFAMLAPLLRASSSGERSVSRRRLVGFSLVAVCAWLLGDLLHRHLSAGLAVNSSYARLQMTFDLQHAWANARVVASLLLKYAGYGGTPMTAAWAMLSLAILVSAILLPLIGRRPASFLATDAGFVYAYAASGSAAILAYLLFYEKIHLWYGIYYGMIVIGPLITVVASRSGAASAAWRSRVGETLLCIALVLGSMQGLMAAHAIPSGYYGISKNQKATSADRAIAVKWLLAHGATRGFAHLWDANAMTLVSEGKLQVSPVLFPRGNAIRRHKWLATIDRINYEPGLETWFIAIPVRHRVFRMPPACLPADIEAKVAAYNLYVYHQPKPGCLPKPLKARVPSSR